MFQAYNHICHLDACIVEVVLHLHLMSQKAKAANKGITQGGIAQVADMCSFVGIDICMLDNDLARLASQVFEDPNQPVKRRSAKELLFNAFGKP